MRKICYLLMCLLFSILVLGACESYPQISNSLDGFEKQVVTLNVGDEYELNIEKIYANAKSDGKNIDIAKYELSVGGKLSVKGNKITALSKGKSSVSCLIYSRVDKCRYITTVADVYIADADNMTEVRTATDLINISKNLGGYYILKDNIDLSVIDNWEAIGLCHGAFTGMFVNPEGYKISNMTIRYAEREEFTRNPYKTGAAGLFGWTENAYFNGIILENVSIYNEDDELLPNTAGGIADNALGGLFINCRVSGDVYAKINAGGIIGVNSWAHIYNCSFEGVINSTVDSESQNGAGGIAGYSGTLGTGIKNCTVNADIYGKIAGGIIGFSLMGGVENCTFEGELFGQKTGETIGFSRND